MMLEASPCIVALAVAAKPGATASHARVLLQARYSHPETRQNLAIPCLEYMYMCSNQYAHTMLVQLAADSLGLLEGHQEGIAAHGILQLGARLSSLAPLRGVSYVSK